MLARDRISVHFLQLSVFIVVLLLSLTQELNCHVNQKK